MPDHDTIILTLLDLTLRLRQGELDEDEYARGVRLLTFGFEPDHERLAHRLALHRSHPESGIID